MEQGNNAKSSIMLVVVAIVCLAIGYALGSQSATKDEGGQQSWFPLRKEAGAIKLGFVGVLTGDGATLGENIRAAVQLATDELNVKGGINGRKIEVIYEDGKCNAKDAATAGTKLINVDKVKAIIGGLCSGETLALAPLAEAAKVPLISSSSTNPSIKEAGDYVFRFIGSDSFQGVFAADYLTKTKNYKKIAVLSCLNDWCVGLSEVFKKQAESNGATIVADESFNPDARDLRSQLTKIRGAKPDAVYFVSMPEGAIVGLKQIKELGIKVPVLGGDAWDDPKIPAETGSAAEGVEYTIAANQKLPASFLDGMKARNADKDLNTYSPRAYDIFQVLTGIIGKVGTDGEKIKNAFYDVQDYKGIADTYSMDENGEVKKAIYIVKEFKKGKAVEVQP